MIYSEPNLHQKIVMFLGGHCVRVIMTEWNEQLDSIPVNLAFQAWAVQSRETCPFPSHL